LVSGQWSLQHFFIESRQAMVIPLQGGAQLRGPIPNELSEQFFYIKYSTLVMMYCYVVRLAFDVIWYLYSKASQENVVAICQAHRNHPEELTLLQLQACTWSPLPDVNLLINVMIAIWLMKDDQTIKKTYDFLTARCCFHCGQNCPGSMACLLLFGIMNLIQVLMAVMHSVSAFSEVWWVFTYAVGLPKIIETDEVSSLDKLIMLMSLMYNAVYVVMHIAMIIATVYAYQAYKMALELGLSQDPMMFGGPGGDGPLLGGPANRFSPPTQPSRPPQGGQGARGAPQSTYRPPAPSTRTAPQQQRFVPFSGQGHSLGSG